MTLRACTAFQAGPSHAAAVARIAAATLKGAIMMSCDGAIVDAVLEDLFFASPERLRRHPCFEDFDAVALFRDEKDGFHDPTVAAISAEARP